MIFIRTLLTLPFLLCACSFAEEIKITISGEVFIPPCKINNGQVIDVDLGTLAASDINGVNNASTKKIAVSCLYSSPPSVSIEGEKFPGVHKNVLQAHGTTGGVDNLGIAFYRGSVISMDQAIEINSSFPWSRPGTEPGQSGGFSDEFEFTVAPYKDSALPLSGEYSATAIIKLVYL